MTTVPDYELSYTPRTWMVYILPWKSESPSNTVDPNLRFCGSTSQMARNLGYHPNRFYVDLELITAGLDHLAGGGEPKRLTADWTAPDGAAYPAGTLVMLPHCGIQGDNPAQWTRTICMEITPADAPA